MALSEIEQLVLWGPPVVMLLVTVGYYVRWGKEADERGDSDRSSGGEA
jgi:cytochrome c-type biogenesis protein CcmH/NrfF